MPTSGSMVNPRFIPAIGVNIRHHELCEFLPPSVSVVNFTLMRCILLGSTLSITIAMVVLTNTRIPQLMFNMPALSTMSAPPSTEVAVPEVNVAVCPAWMSMLLAASRMKSVHLTENVSTVSKIMSFPE